MTYGPPPDYPKATSSPPIIVLVAGLAAVLGFLIGYLTGLGSSVSADEPAPKTTVTIEQSPLPPLESDTAQPSESGTAQPLESGTAQPSVTGTAQPTATGTAPVSPAPTGAGGGSVPGNGTHAVGVDIQPGTYTSTGPTAGQSMCYWARLKDTTPDLANVIDSGMPKGAATVTIVATDKVFQTGGCADWIRQ